MRLQAFIFKGFIIYFYSMRQLPDPDTPFAAIDLETTGLHPFHSEIVEAAGVRFNLKGEILGEFCQLINPCKPIPPRAKEIHGITDEMVADKPLWGDVAGSFYTFIEDAILVAHNAPFDLSFLTFKGTVVGLPFPDSYVIDTLTVSREIYPTNARHTLSDLSVFLGIELNNAHRAFSDAKACCNLLLKQITAYDHSWEDFASNFVFHTADWQTLTNIPEDKIALVQACREGSDLEITYIDSEGVVTQRRITPLQLNRIRQVPYLFGHCHLRDAGRNFRLDRIQNWIIT